NNWSALGSGLSGQPCQALTVDAGGTVYAGGAFSSAGGAPNTQYIAKWNGSSWSSVGTGINNICYALEADGTGNVYAGGAFTNAGGNTAKYIARWDGSNWFSLGTGLGGACRGIGVDGSGQVFAGGNFTGAGGITANHIAKWDGSNWSALGNGLSGSCEEVAVDANGNVYAVGSNVAIPGVAGQGLAVWNGSIWQGPCGGINTSSISNPNNSSLFIQAVLVFNSELFVGGIFSSAFNQSAFNIASGLLPNILQPPPSVDVQSTCGPFTWIDGNTYTASNNSATYTLIGGAANGCDSIVNLDLTINQPTTGIDIQISCGPFIWIDGNTYTASNNSATYTLVGGAANGCDSTVTLDLTINQVATGIDVQVSCGPFIWIDGNTYTASNNSATFTLIGAAANGCDSTVALDLTINQVSTGIDVQTSCGPFTWIDGNTYAASNNSATFTLIGAAANGCDSTVALDVTINQAATGTDAQINCGPFTWIDGNTYTASNNTATYTIIGGAANGCDSIVSLDLTVNQVATGVDVQVNCGPFTWIDGNTYTASNNSATFTLVGGAANGCDSIVSLYLTVNQLATGVDVQINCGPFTWIDGNTYTSSNNSATYTIIGGAANGCDSIVSLDLTVNQPQTGTDVQVSCGSFIWIDGNTYTSSNNTASYTLVGGAANGCDSTVQLDLTINQIDPSVVDAGTSLIAAQQQATYQWLDCDLGFSPIPNETSDAFSPSRSGNYAVEISLGTCKDTSSCVNYLAVGINEGFAEQISFYPNPTKEVITIELSRSFPEIEVQIMDVWGRTLTKKMLYNQERFELPIQDPPGTYFIQIRAQAWGVSTFKVLKR
ncbi:MAG: T9SS type A sorting domain-containing protein, partial [Bacteroidota bacterium]